MSIVIDTEPPPLPSLRQTVESLDVGQSAQIGGYSLRVARTTVSRVRKTHPDRIFRTGTKEGVPRVWRLA